MNSPCAHVVAAEELELPRSQGSQVVDQAFGVDGVNGVEAKEGIGGPVFAVIVVAANHDRFDVCVLQG